MEENNLFDPKLYESMKKKNFDIEVIKKDWSDISNHKYNQDKLSKKEVDDIISFKTPKNMKDCVENNHIDTFIPKEDISTNLNISNSIENFDDINFIMKK